MDVVGDSAKREALAQRMSKLLGLPITNIQLLMPLISKDDLEKLESLPDDQFLSQATKIINAAQKRQFEEKDAAPAAPSQPAAPGASPTPTAPNSRGEVEEEPVAPMRRKLGRKSAKADESAADESMASEAAVEATADGEPAAADMPAVFHKPVKKESMLGDKKLVIALAVGGVGGLIFIALAGVLAFMMLRTPATPPPEALVPTPTDHNPTPVVVTYANESALKLTSTFDMPVSLGSDLTGPITAEMWIKPLGGTGKQEVLVSGDGNEETFRLLFRHEEDGSYYTEFAVAPAGRDVASYRMDASATGKWIHLAGVYDPTVSGQLLLFVSGTPIAKVATTEVPDMITNSYRLICAVTGETEGMIVDEVRVTNSAVYTSDFEPPRVLAVLGDTKSLLHLEKWDDGKVKDAARNNTELEFSGAEIVDIKSEMGAPDIFRVLLAPIPFPPELIGPLTQEMTEPWVSGFLREWDAKSRTQRIAYLHEIRYPEERIAMLTSKPSEPAPEEPTNDEAPAPAPAPAPME